MAAHDAVWPLYFAACDIEGKKFRCKKGELLPFTDKAIIRGIGVSLGLKDVDRIPFSSLPYVKVLNARGADMARHIQTLGLRYEQARKHVEQPAEVA